MGILDAMPNSQKKSRPTIHDLIIFYKLRSFDNVGKFSSLHSWSMMVTGTNKRTRFMDTSHSSLSQNLISLVLPTAKYVHVIIQNKLSIKQAKYLCNYFPLIALFLVTLFLIWQKMYYLFECFRVARLCLNILFESNVSIRLHEFSSRRIMDK